MAALYWPQGMSDAGRFSLTPSERQYLTGTLALHRIIRALIFGCLMVVVAAILAAVVGGFGWPRL
jgi:hypothetical protein